MSAIERAPELSPAGEGREREVRCTRCGRTNWNHSAQCWLCIDRERRGDQLDENELHDGEDL